MKGCQGRAPTDDAPIDDRAIETVTRPVNTAEAQQPSSAASKHHRADPLPPTRLTAEPEKLYTDTDDERVSAFRAKVAAEAKVAAGLSRPRGKKGRRKRRQQEILRCTTQSSQVCSVGTMLNTENVTQPGIFSKA